MLSGLLLPTSNNEHHTVHQHSTSPLLCCANTPFCQIRDSAWLHKANSQGGKEAVLTCLHVSSNFAWDEKKKKKKEKNFHGHRCYPTYDEWNLFPAKPKSQWQSQKINLGFES